MELRVLGAHNLESRNTRMESHLIDGQLALEVKEWVVDPCFEVVAALTIRGYHTEPLSRSRVPISSSN